MTNAIETLPASYRIADNALADRTVLVTGAGNGLGRAVARAAANAGASVVLLDRQLKALEEVYDEIEAAGGPQPALYPMDLLGATPDDVAELSERLGETFGRLDGVVHCAAELGKPAPLGHYDVQSWLRTVHINLSAPFLLTRYTLPLSLAAAEPRIVFVGDIAGREARPFMGGYAASKWGIEGLALTLAAEQPDDARLRVTTVDPGPLNTMLRRKGWPSERTGDLPLPEDVAPSLLYLIDPGETPEQGGRYRYNPEM